MRASPAARQWDARWCRKCGRDAFFIADSMRSSSAAFSLFCASNTAFPLESNVRTLLNPALSRQRISSLIFAFIGLTPRRNAAYGGIDFLPFRSNPLCDRFGVHFFF